ncbi:uncharacterized protein LOC134811517 [Bolinopsis microptera]|uniref:uncharacterized protein LOC134811517 n=1 Tax=Bolinopsis microptera TaxID=2820187 RepID=UPI00307A3D9A
MWYKSGSNLISVALCVTTCILTFNYWSISQDMVILDAQVKVCRQKELDYNGVATECKKRITELHDKISILNSDKEVIATQKFSLSSLADARLNQINEANRNTAEVNEKLTECESREGTASEEKAELSGRIQELVTTNQELQEQNQEMVAKIQTLTEQLAAAQPAAQPAQEA